MADHWVGTHYPDKMFPFARAIFAAQGSFFGAATTTMSPNEVKDQIVSVATNASIGINATEFLAGINNHTTDLATRVAWKTATSRGNYETPSFYLNGFRVMQGWPPYQGVAPPKLAANLTVWTTMIDALLETTPY